MSVMTLRKCAPRAAEWLHRFLQTTTQIDGIYPILSSLSYSNRNLSGDSHSRRTLQFQCAKFPPPLLQIALSGPCYVSILALHNDQGHFYHCIILFQMSLPGVILFSDV